MDFLCNMSSSIEDILGLFFIIKNKKYYISNLNIKLNTDRLSKVSFTININNPIIIAVNSDTY